MILLLKYSVNYNSNKKIVHLNGLYTLPGIWSPNQCE